MRLLLGHPNVDLVAVTSRNLVGKSLAEVFPRFANDKKAAAL
ncbi:MAG: N-acetyl-gamma-glutamyl-phosphate reductase, partial [Verrucomicrobia bacterium]|nr:N-acetyl-gamma-glutamyl-phosphate reductase [Verrucomicrobiota bacterium]